MADVASLEEFRANHSIGLLLAVESLLLVLTGAHNSCCCLPAGILLMLVGRTTTPGVAVLLLLVQPGLLLLILWFDLAGLVYCFSAVRHVRQAYNTPGLREPRTKKVVEGLGSGATQERENKTETEIEQGLAAQERELGAVVESFATVLGEVSELSAAVSQMREMLVQITDAINQHPQLAIGRARTRRRRIRRTLAAGGYFSCNETFTQGMETTWHQETLSGACVRELSDRGHLCCGNAKCAT